MFLPHEVVGAFYRFGEKDLMKRLIGGPGVTCQGKSNPKTRIKIYMFVPQQLKNATCTTCKNIVRCMHGY